MGKTRAKQMDLLKSEKDCKLGDRVMCIQLHGDAVSKHNWFILVYFLFKYLIEITFLFNRHLQVKVL